MDIIKEKDFVEVCIKKRWQDRFFYELSSNKKREHCISKLSHNIELYIDVNKADSIKNLSIDLFANFSNQKIMAYVLSYEHIQGIELSLNEAYEYIVDSYGPVVLYTDAVIVIKSEFEFGSSNYYVFKKSR